jgi:hypothetical protein
MFGPGAAAPAQIIVLPAFDRDAVVGQAGVPPVLVDTVEGEWVET